MSRVVDDVIHFYKTKGMTFEQAIRSLDAHAGAEHPPLDWVDEMLADPRQHITARRLIHQLLLQHEHIEELLALRSELWSALRAARDTGGTLP